MSPVLFVTYVTGSDPIFVDTFLKDRSPQPTVGPEHGNSWHIGARICEFAPRTSCEPRCTMIGVLHANTDFENCHVNQYA
jgi:hypothetical protein